MRKASTLGRCATESTMPKRKQISLCKTKGALHLQFQCLLQASWSKKKEGGTLEQVCVYKKTRHLPPQLQVRDLFNSLQLDLLQKLTPAGLYIALTNHLHQAMCQWKERGPASWCSRCYIQQCGPLPEPLNGCLAPHSVQKQSSWSGQHSKLQHFTEHIHISPAPSPGELAVCRQDGR